VDLPLFTLQAVSFRCVLAEWQDTQLMGESESFIGRKASKDLPHSRQLYS